MFRVRCSSLPQISLCSASAYPPALNIVRPSGEPARLGDAVHEAMRIYIEDGAEAAVGALAQKHQVDVDELGYLCYAGRKAWESIAPMLPEPRCEEEFTWVDEASQIVLEGHPDVFSANLDNLIVPDWKSGFRWSDCEPQLRGYAWLIAQQFPVRTVTALHVNIRRGEIERFDWTYEELADWWRSMATRINEGREVYGPDYEACRYCRRWHECPAGQELATTAIGILTEIDKDVQIPHSQAADAYQRAKFVIKVAEGVVEHLRTMTAAAGGELESGGGDGLVLERQKREKIDASIAYGQAGIAHWVNKEQFIEACSVGKTKLLDAVRANSPRGQKKEAADACMEFLRTAGAVTETFIEKLELRKAPKAVANEPKELVQL